MFIAANCFVVGTFSFMSGRVGKGTLQRAPTIICAFRRREGCAVAVGDADGVTRRAAAARGAPFQGVFTYISRTLYV